MQTLNHLLLAALGTGAATLALAHTTQEPLRPVAGDARIELLATDLDDPDMGNGAASTAPDALRDDLVARLSEPDLDLRERHFDDIVRAAAGDAALRLELDQLARDDGRELAWTARLALRAVEREARAQGTTPWSGAPTPFGGAGPFGGARPFGGASPFLGRTPFAGGDPFEELEARMQRLFESGPFGGPGLFGQGVGGPSPFGGADPFEDLRQELEALRGRSFGGDATVHGHSQRMEITPDGVRVEVTERGPDGDTTRTFEAPTLEELYELHPELRQ